MYQLLGGLLGEITLCSSTEWSGWNVWVHLLAKEWTVTEGTAGIFRTVESFTFPAAFVGRKPHTQNQSHWRQQRFHPCPDFYLISTFCQFFNSKMFHLNVLWVQPVGTYRTHRSQNTGESISACLLANTSKWLYKTLHHFQSMWSIFTLRAKASLNFYHCLRMHFLGMQQNTIKENFIWQIKLWYLTVWNLVHFHRVCNPGPNPFNIFLFYFIFKQLLDILWHIIILKVKSERKLEGT